MSVKNNQGYVITNSITVGESKFVLGVHDKTPNSFVTWQCKENDKFFWGHYFDNLLSAQKDFCKRALDEVKYLENRVKKPKETEVVR